MYDKNARRYDLMSDDEVCTLSSDDLQSILIRLAELCRRGDNFTGLDIYHRLKELNSRYPSSYRNIRFRIEVVGDE